MSRLIPIEPLTAEAFAPFGDVITTEGKDYFMINNGSTRRYHKLATVEAEGQEASAIISIFRAQALPMPLTVTMMERHPLGSQAFIPLKGQPFLILVGPKGDQLDPASLRCFISDGSQGVNYHKGVWHHPVLALAAEDDFLVVDRSGSGNNCEEIFFPPEQQPLLQP